ncbi:AraC family transcriptional regulator [Curtobacterium sp. VKM Ac-2922]|uniref:AraC family transcriptional regulator n=1 Tax=Curtobacterium sp. VKM Ac-2922 TaxID=2929475 RepID=UPI001FB55530|nr:AraC family transcriptional regulator [Curtobacterium sp. VKM Ac-2922]MCJ1712913.1 AraC family transcriptional regulator [Curtobacterium sp. VKM Ac-2922]
MSERDVDAAGVPDLIRFEVAGRDPEAAARELAAVGAGQQWVARRTAEAFSYRYTAVGDSEVTVRRSRTTGFLRGVIRPVEHYVVQWITSGSAAVEVDGERVDLRPDEPTLYPTEQEFVFVAADHDQRLVHLHRDLVRRVAGERYEIGAGPLRFEQPRSSDELALGRWNDALGALSRALRDGVESSSWADAKRGAVDAFLLLFPPHVDALPAALSLPKNARVRAMVEHVHAHVREPVSVAELSAVSGLSVRSVQESFARVLGVSPLTYVREVRLDRVRQELLELDPRDVTVGDVARRWGFAHLGRFSAVYLDRFGEYPKQTLRR